MSGLPVKVKRIEMTIKINAERHYPLLLFIILYKIVLSFKAVCETFFAKTLFFFLIFFKTFFPSESVRIFSDLS